MRHQFALAIVGLALLLFGCGGSYPVHTYRYKLTLEALVNGEVRRASSVVQKSMSMRQDLGAGLMATYGLKGEALFFDLSPECQPLVALLNRLQSTKRVGTGFGWTTWAGVSGLETLYGLARLEWKGQKLKGWDAFSRQRGPRELTPLQLPQLVTFTNVADPKTVEQVDPENPGAALGCQFEWQRITIEVTDEPVTTGIEKQLGWRADRQARERLNQDWKSLSETQQRLLSSAKWQEGTGK